MNFYSINKQEENKDRFKSLLISLGIWSGILAFIFFYTIKSTTIKHEEPVSAMLINFGDNRNGNGIEEPANQEGSLASQANASLEEAISEPISKPKEETPTPETPVKIEKKAPKAEKILSGNSTKNKVSVKESKSETKKAAAPTSSSTKKTTSKSNTPNSATGSGDGKGTAAIGNLIKGRGTKAGTQGTGGTVGNAGDPLGGDGNGDSKIGVDRRLVGYIPGTMGRGGAQPTHNCSASGSISIAYTVDKAGNVTEARRSGGSSDPCISSTTVSWVKKYVKAEKANFSSTGTYRITF